MASNTTNKILKLQSIAAMLEEFHVYGNPEAERALDSAAAQVRKAVKALQDAPECHES